MRLVVFITSLFIFSTCTKNISAIAHIKGINSNPINGVATFVEENGFVKLVVKLRGADSGKLAIHIHQIGDCQSLDGSSAGGHWNPTEAEHGKWGVKSFHSGDIGNVNIDENGNGLLELKDHFKRWSISDPSNNNIIGRSIIVHSGVDDMKSQPSGAAGPRIGCGVIK